MDVTADRPRPSLLRAAAASLVFAVVTAGPLAAMSRLPAGEAVAKGVVWWAALCAMWTAFTRRLLTPIPVAASGAGIRVGSGVRARVHNRAQLRGVAICRSLPARAPSTGVRVGEAEDVLLLRASLVDGSRLRAALASWPLPPDLTPDGPSPGAGGGDPPAPLLLCPRTWEWLVPAVTGLALAAAAAIVVSMDRPQTAFWCALGAIGASLAGGASLGRWRRGTLLAGPSGVDVDAGAARFPWSRIEAVLVAQRVDAGAVLATGVWPQGFGAALIASERRGLAAQLKALRREAAGRAPGPVWPEPDAEPKPLRASPWWGAERAASAVLIACAWFWFVAPPALHEAPTGYMVTAPAFAVPYVRVGAAIAAVAGVLAVAFGIRGALYVRAFLRADGEGQAGGG